MEKVKSIYKNVIIVLIISFLYSILRYNIIKDVEWAHFPLFIFNKAISLSAVILMVMSVISGRKAINSERYKILAMRYGWVGFQFVVLHVIISLTLLNADYYNKFFQSGRLNFTGELSLLLGIGAFVLLVIYSINAALQRWGVEPFHPGINNNFIRSTAVILIGAHLFVMGIKGWIDILSWPGGLLPISLLGFIMILLIILMGFVRIKKKSK